MQRYGAEVVGGSEGHARVVARRLARTNEIEIATTDALDYWTWQPHFPTGVSVDEGVIVRRFPVEGQRDPEFKSFESRVLSEPHPLGEEMEWLRRQGPHVPGLLEFLHAEGHRYEAVIFYTYIYAPTALGLPLVPERAALVSTAHDEAPLDLAPYRALFALPRAIGFLTPEERALVHRRFRNEHIPSEVLGMGLDPMPAADGAAFRSRRGLRGPIVLYLGQVSEGKGCDELLRMWTAYRDRGGAGALVLVGTVRMEIPQRPDVVALGRVSDDEKWAALAAADALVLPSHLESLGIVLLEAWQARTAVLVPAWNAVTAGQVARSGGGLTYGSETEFGARLAALLDGAGREIGARGREWVARECTWEAFDARLGNLVDMAAFSP